MQELYYTLCVQESFNEVDFTVQCFNDNYTTWLSSTVYCFFGSCFGLVSSRDSILKYTLLTLKKLSFSFYSIEMAKEQKWIGSHRLQNSEQIGTIN
jgi:hypothetical protein